MYPAIEGRGKNSNGFVIVISVNSLSMFSFSHY